MNRQEEFCKIIYDKNGDVTRLVCQQLNYDYDWLSNSYTLGFVVDHKLVGGLIYHNIRLGRDLWWTIYTSDKRWCNRRVLKIIFGLAFDYWKVKRISLLIDTDNLSCLRLVEKLGFKREGLLRQYRDNGKDCYFYGMLQSENKWR